MNFKNSFLIFLSLIFQMILPNDLRAEKRNHYFGNLRLSFLLFPSSPLITLETKITNKLTLQFETNTAKIHGFNVKYFLGETMRNDFLFFGSAFVKDPLLREDEKTTTIPYIGYGYAFRFGENDEWILDTRIGLGRSLDADRNSFYPIIKVGLGLML